MAAFVALATRLCGGATFPAGRLTEGVAPWPKYFVFSMTIPSTAIRRPMPGRSSPSSTTIPMADAADARARSISSRAQLLGSVSGELGLRKFLEKAGHTLVVTSDKDGPNSVFEKELPDAEIVISQPFWPAYLTKERFAKAKKLKLAITAGIGSDHVDLAGGDEQRHHRRRGDLVQLDQRRRARGHDDPGARAQLHPVLRMGRQRRLEHRRLRRALL